MATDDRHSGTLRTDYETDPAQLHGLPAMESSWQRLLHRLVRYGKGLEYRDDDGQEGTLAPPAGEPCADRGCRPHAQTAVRL